MPLTFDDAALDEAARFNVRLAHAPRFGSRHRFMPPLVQGLLRLSQIGADRRLRRAGLQVETRMVGLEGVQVQVRIIRPRGPVAGIVLDIHGGGWVIGNAAMNDAFNAAFASRCGLAVVSVDYRLAPRASVHEQMEECLAAARWLLQDGLSECADLPVIVVGESAGAHLAAATLQGLRAWPALLARIAGPSCTTASTIWPAPTACAGQGPKRWCSTGRACWPGCAGSRPIWTTPGVASRRCHRCSANWPACRQR